MPAARKKRPHKQIFMGVAEQVAEIAKSHGFVDHPAYETGWDPQNQNYTRHLIRPICSQFIDQFEVCYYPNYKGFFISVRRLDRTPERTELLGRNCTAFEWTHAYSINQRVQYDLWDGNHWNPFSGRTAFHLKNSDFANVDVAISKIMKRISRNMTFLFDALNGEYKGRLVHVRDRGSHV